MTPGLRSGSTVPNEVGSSNPVRSIGTVDTCTIEPISMKVGRLFVRLARCGDGSFVAIILCLSSNVATKRLRRLVVYVFFMRIVQHVSH
jgi:hypothetical protein